jgi:hypothetical protein
MSGNLDNIAKGIKNQVKSLYKTTTPEANDDNDIEIIEHLSQFSPGIIHSQARQRLRQQSSNSKSSNNYNGSDVTTQEVPISTPLSLSVIKKLAKEKVSGKNDKFFNNNNTNHSAPNESPSAHNQGTKRPRISIAGENNLISNGTSTAAASSRILQREASPEVRNINISFFFPKIKPYPKIETLI